MHILVINPILYTAETREVPQVKSIKDSMIYDLCLAFFQQGHHVTLYAARDYRPACEETYPFEIIWDECFLPAVFAPHRLPLLKNLTSYLRENRNAIDLVISSEVFSANTFLAYQLVREKLVVWHELAMHNRMMKKIPSKIWYNVIARLFMGNAFVVARSQEARGFIRHYCRNVSDEIIDHGVNLDKFPVSEYKTNSFVVCSQLISRKRIGGILDYFARYMEKYDKGAVLYIIGEGEERQHLQEKAYRMGMERNVVFKGKLDHANMKAYLMEARALLVNTIQDNSMISIVEAIAVGTPVVTTDVPLNSSYIRSEKLGIAKPAWNEDDMREVVQENGGYAANCLQYRHTLSTHAKAAQFIRLSGRE